MDNSAQENIYPVLYFNILDDSGLLWGKKVYGINVCKLPFLTSTKHALGINKSSEKSWANEKLVLTSLG